MQRTRDTASISAAANRASSSDSSDGSREIFLVLGNLLVDAIKSLGSCDGWGKK